MIAPTKAVKVLEDGTRVYRSGKTYKPAGRRVNARRQPDDPRAVRFHDQWFVPLELLDDEKRVMPPTREDREAYDHMSRTVLCRCDVCLRPAAERWRARWRVDHGLRR